MIDTKFLQQFPELVKTNNKNRGKEVDVQVMLDMIAARADLLAQVQEERTKLNEMADQISKTKSKDERDALIEKSRLMKEMSRFAQSELEITELAISKELKNYPNILRDDVPVGADERANQIVRTFAQPPVFNFEPKDHLDLGEALGVIDMQRAAKVAGARFVYLKGDAVLLEFALLQYALRTTSQEGFTPVVPPHLITTQSMSAMGYLEHGGEEEIYHLKNDDLVLIGTSEQVLGPMHADEILDADKLPLRYVGFSPCYRREAGSYGKDTRGILSVHQFDKVEMFSFTTPDKSDDEHELLLSIQERLMQGLKLPYKVVKLCSGDTGAPSARTYDIETWIPSQKTYRETHSTSNTTDFQTRRLNIRTKQAGKNVFVHALNGTAFAIGRVSIAIMENYQQEDGSVVVPEVLQAFVGKDRIEKISQ